MASNYFLGRMHLSEQHTCNVSLHLAWVQEMQLLYHLEQFNYSVNGRDNYNTVRPVHYGDFSVSSSSSSSSKPLEPGRHSTEMARTVRSVPADACVSTARSIWMKRVGAVKMSRYWGLG